MDREPVAAQGGRTGQGRRNVVDRSSQFQERGVPCPVGVDGLPAHHPRPYRRLCRVGGRCEGEFRVHRSRRRLSAARRRSRPAEGDVDDMGAGKHVPGSDEYSGSRNPILGVWPG
ncbi:hypothetical protein SNL152K_10315 [Streptomyces sp. NL15-2K]|nr:hypothetical protein SNL152K_10315 [Streptomyces sp. NL15-2K]